MERLRVIKSYWIGLAGVCIVLSRGLFVFWGFFFLVVLRIFLVSNVGMPGFEVREGVGLGRMSGKKCNRVQTPRCIVALRSPEICARGCTRVLHTTAAKVSSVSLHLLFNYPPLRLYINTTWLITTSPYATLHDTLGSRVRLWQAIRVTRESSLFH